MFLTVNSNGLKEECTEDQTATCQTETKPKKKQNGMSVDRTTTAIETPIKKKKKKKRKLTGAVESPGITEQESSK